MSLGRRFRFTSRALAFAMALAALVSLRPANASPGDVFAIAAPLIGAAAPKATDVADGDASVSTQTGAFEYSFKIATPPGRNGAQPQLALSYSSQGPTYGTLAAGWSLSLPAILEDTSQGRLDEVAKLQPRRYLSTLAGGRPLVPVTEPGGVAGDVAQAYRAQKCAARQRRECLTTC